MIVQLSILCVIAIPGHPFIKMPLLFKNVLNTCISSASHGSNKAKKHSSAICYLPSVQNWGLRSYYKSYFFTEFLHKAYTFLLEMFIIPELIMQCNPGDDHTWDFVGFPHPVFQALKRKNNQMLNWTFF